MSRTLVISINAAWNVLNFRRGLVAALRAEGWHVVALTPSDEYGARLGEIGVEHVPLPIDSAGLSPVADLRLIARYYRLMKRIRPDAFLGYTAKPNVYGSLAAHALGIPVVNNISGLGTAFIEKGPLRNILSSLYRLALRRSATVFFQNPEDRDLFVRSGLVKAGQARLVPGSGIDLDRFAPADVTRGADATFTFLLTGRLLWQKGVREYVEAARLVRAQVPATRFRLLGFLDSANVSAVGPSDVHAWQSEGLIEYLGHTDDVRPHIAAADCIVLPSYREGLPRSLLEGAAMAKPLIATDVPGCRQAVEHGSNGLLCAVRDSRSLADSMIEMARLSDDRRRQMGQAGRVRVERDYAESVVIGAYLRAIEDARVGGE